MQRKSYRSAAKPHLDWLEDRRLMSVALWQTEADGDAAAGDQYAAVNFNGATTLVANGVTFHALAGTTSTYSGHAATVLSSFQNYSNSALSDDWADSADSIYNDIRAYSSTGGSNGAPLLIKPPTAPSGVGGFVNNSWVGGLYVGNYSGSYSLASLDARALDYWVASQNLLMTSAAVSDGTTGEMMGWIGRNQIAVRGSQGFSIAGQSVRLHADVFGPDDTYASFTTPEVGGIAAKMYTEAQAAGNPDGQQHEVAKSIIMSSDDKGGFDSSFTSWSRQVGNLDQLAGAGRVVSSRCDTIYNDGEMALTALSSLTSGTVINAPAVTSSGAGWSYVSSIGEGSQVAVIVNAGSAFSDINATLAWDVMPKLIGQRIDGGAENFANLDLRMFNVNFAGGTYTLGSALNGLGLSSTTTNDNVEHIYYNGSTLPAGYYAFVIQNVMPSTPTGYVTDAGFSYVLNAPTGPGTVTTSYLSPTSFRVNWSDNSGEESSYKVEVATDAGFSQNLQTFYAASNSSSFDVTGRAMGQTYYVRITTMGSAMNSLSVTGSYNPAPFVVSSQVNDGLIQRSMITSLSLQFSEPVTLTNALLLTRRGTALANTMLNIATSDQINYTITFSGSDIVGLSLPDGGYKLAVSASGVKDSTSLTMAGNYQMSFHRLFGDYNGDRMVNAADLSAFRAALNNPSSYIGYFDFDNNGVIDRTDYLQFRARLVRSMLA